MYNFVSMRDVITLSCLSRDIKKKAKNNVTSNLFFINSQTIMSVLRISISVPFLAPHIPQLTKVIQLIDD